MALASARQAVAVLDANYVERTIEAVHALEKLESVYHAAALRSHLCEVLSLLETIRDDKVPNAALVQALEESRRLQGRFGTAEELFDALEADAQK